MESTMRAKLWVGGAIVAATVGSLAVNVSPASAQPWVGPAFIAGGLVAAATSPLWAPGLYGYYDYYPGYAYGPAYGLAPEIAGTGAVAYCEARFRSYNPATGTYLGYDGLRHPCP
jgi:hypothetical protein